MKKHIKQIAIFAIFAVFASCSSDDDSDLDIASVGGNVVPATASISRLDTSYNIPLNLLTKEGVTVSKIEIYKDEAKISDATISGDKATFNTSTLGSFDEFGADGIAKTGTFSLSIRSTYSDGSTTKAPYTLTVGKGIVWKVLDDDGEPTTTSTTSGQSTVKLNDPTPVNIHYAAVKKSTTVIDNVIGEWAKNGSTTFTALPGTFSTEKQTIDVAAIPYSTYGGIAVGDKITYRFTVNSGTQSDVITTTIQFVNQVFGSDKNVNISNLDDTNKFSFATGLNYDKLNTEDAEIVFLSNFGIKAEGTTDIHFVKSTLDYATADLFAADAAYSAGTKVTTLTNLATGDVILYKITRSVNFGTNDEPEFEDVDYYGIIKITDHIAGSTSQTLKFTYKEGILSI